MLVTINIISLMIGFGMTFLNISESNKIESGVYNWPLQNVIDKDEIIFQGDTNDFKDLKLFAKTVLPNDNYQINENELEYETLIIFKQGKSKLSFENNEKVLGPGSISIIFAGEKYLIENIGEDNVEFYLFNYRSKDPINKERGKEEGGSFCIDWNDVEFTPHDKGRVRQYCEKKTEMLKYFSLHVTTLNSGIKSHEPHMHKSDELVIMIKGNTEMQIGDNHYNGTDGDVYFLGANIPHAIGNKGDESCMYYAFHWE